MSRAIICDGCGRSIIRGDDECFDGWWAIQDIANWADRKTVFERIRNEDNPTMFQVCSWDCVVQLAMGKVDLFKGPFE